MCYRAVGLDVGSLQSDCDTVEEDEEEGDMIKHLVTDHPVTPHSEPDTHTQKGDMERCVHVCVHVCVGCVWCVWRVCGVCVF